MVQLAEGKAQRKPRTFRLPYEPDGQQWEWHNDKSRFRVIVAGRRRGKSYFAAAEAFFVCRDVWQKEARPARIWIVAPSYSLVREDWMVCHQLFGKLITDKRKAERTFRLSVFGGPLFEFKSADTDDQSLRGAGLDLVVVDEASRVGEDAWNLGLRPTLSDRGTGRAVFISTPNGRNWFYDLYKRGTKESPEHEDGWRSWRSKSCERPTYKKSEWDVLKKEMPAIAFMQECEAEFVDNATAVFHGHEDCFAGGWEEPQEGEMYVMGVDLGRHNDFTVSTVWKRSSRHMVHMNRSQDILWQIQKESICELAERYNNALVVVDATGAGSAIVEDLIRMGVSAKPVEITATSRPEMLQRLAVAIQNREITFPRDPEIAKELDGMEVRLSKDGRRMRWDHRKNAHDDIVFSMALALRSLGRPALAQLERDIPRLNDKYGSNRIAAYAGMHDERAAWLYG